MNGTGSFTRLSVIIPNHNYGHYVSEAIESALALQWPDVEVVVVDDGSTDHSRQIIAGYPNRVHPIFQSHRGPRVACNVGFAASTGDAVIFLDSDDILQPDLPERVAVAWGPTVSKVQGPMLRIDDRGRPLGRPVPRWRQTPTAQDVRRWLLDTSAYPTPPGSGNVYARTFLEKIMPLDDRCGDATDSACLAAAPILGDVMSVNEPLARYRRHESNRSRLNDALAFRRHLERAHQRHRYVVELAEQRYIEVDTAVGTLFKSRHLLQLRVALARLDSTAPAALPGDDKARMLRDSLKVWRAPGPEGLITRIFVSAWALAVLAAPRPLAERLIDWRFH